MQNVNNTLVSYVNISFIVFFLFLITALPALAYTTPNLVNTRFIVDITHSYFGCQYIDQPTTDACNNELVNFSVGETLYFSGNGLNDGFSGVVESIDTGGLAYHIAFVKPNDMQAEAWNAHGGYIVTNVEPVTPPVFTIPTFSLIKPGEPGLLASVGDPIIGSVQETGKAVWPLFVFVGVLLAFVIALQVLVFTKRAVGGSTGTRKTRKKSEFPDDVPVRDRQAYKRGKKIMEDEFPGFYD